MGVSIPAGFSTAVAKAAGGGGASKSGLDKVLDILGSKGGQTLVGAGGAALSAYGANKANEAQLAQNANQFRASTALRQQEDANQNQLNRATSAAELSPLGQDQSFAQKQALLKTILGSARNFSATPGDPAVAGAMGHVSGGLALPTGGLDPDMLERMFGDATTQSSIAQHAKAVGQVNPRAPIMDLSPMYGKSADGSENAFMTDMRQSNQDELNRQMDEESRQRAIIQAAIDDDVNHEKQQTQKHGNIFGKILKGASLGASFIPGLGQVLGPALGFAGGLANGDGLKSAAAQGAMAALPAGMGKVAKLAPVAKVASKVKF
jgi:hypothetical protein